MIGARAWRERSAAERRAIAIGVLGVAAVLLVAFVWLPLERLRTRLAQELPAMRASLAALEADAQEAKRLRAMPPVAARTDAPLATLATNAGGLAGAQVTVIDERRVRLTGTDVGFAALLEWLRAAQATHGMRVDSARLDALPTAGRVRAELVLSRS